MSRLSPELANRIRDEIALIDREATLARHAWERAKLNKEDHDYLVKAVALILHSFYSAIERVFHQIARHVDNEVPSGPAWHRDLLIQMSAERLTVRPAVISAVDAAGLGAYLGFRHAIRNIYTYSLQPLRIGELVDELPQVWESVRRHLEHWLKEMAE